MRVCKSFSRYHASTENRYPLRVQCNSLTLAVPAGVWGDVRHDRWWRQWRVAESIVVEAAMGPGIYCQSTVDQSTFRTEPGD